MSGFYRPCWTEIDARALRDNFKALKSLSPQTELLAVVKANGYGHGLRLVSQIAVDAGAAALGVSSLEEGIELRKLGFILPVLILGSLYPFQNFPVLFEHGLTPTIASLAAANALDAVARAQEKKIAVHLKIDSGFGRIGVSLAHASAFITQVSQRSGLIIEGLYTHFASSDVDPDYTRQQAKSFLSVVDHARAAGIRPRWIHMANSAAFLRYAETRSNFARPGLAFYGLSPYEGEKPIALAPALAWKTQVVFIKTVPPGTSVSYARTWTAARQSRVATLAVGYADGFPRQASNKAQLLIRGRRAPVVGRVTMDMMMADVTDIPDCHIGDEAILIGAQGNDRITAHDLAKWSDTNAYDIVCRIGSRVPRVTLHE